MGMQPTSQAWVPLLPPAHMQQPLTQSVSDCCDHAAKSGMQLRARVQVKCWVWLTNFQTPSV